MAAGTGLDGVDGDRYDLLATGRDADAMMFEPSSTYRRARLTTIALATAAFITLSDNALAQRFDRPLLDVPYVPTPPEVVDRMLEMATVQRDDFVIDLGSGDGRIGSQEGRACTRHRHRSRAGSRSPGQCEKGRTAG